MVAVLEPSSVTSMDAGYFAWSAEDDRAYLVTTGGAIPLLGGRDLTTLDDAFLSAMGPDGLTYVNGVLVPILPASPIAVEDWRFAGDGLRNSYTGGIAGRTTLRCSRSAMPSSSF